MHDLYEPCMIGTLITVAFHGRQLNSTAQHSSCKDIDLQRMVLAVIPDMHVMLFVSYELCCNPQ